MITTRHKVLFGKLVENGRTYRAKPLGELLVESGYSPNTAIAPTKVTQSKGFQQLLEEHLPDTKLLDAHKKLLSSQRLDHMVFPLGPKDEDEPNLSGANPNEKNPMDDLTHPVERTTLTDIEIKDMLSEVGGTVRRIVHGQTARHVYFWVPNDKARQDALKLAYDIKGKLASKEPPATPTNVYNTQFNVNSPSARALADKMLEVAMEQTKRKVTPSG